MYDNDGVGHGGFIHPYPERGPSPWDEDLVDQASGATWGEMYANREAPSMIWARGSEGLLMHAEDMYVMHGMYDEPDGQYGDAPDEDFTTDDEPDDQPAGDTPNGQSAGNVKTKRKLDRGILAAQLQLFIG